MTAFEIGYPGYWDDRKRLGFRQETRLIPESIRIKARLLTGKAGDDAAEVAAITSAAERLLRAYLNPAPVAGTPATAVPAQTEPLAAPPDPPAPTPATIVLSAEGRRAYKPPVKADRSIHVFADQPPLSLLADFPRGDPNRTPEDADKGGFKAPNATFVKTSRLLDPVAQWRPGKFLLGVVEGQEAEDDEGREFIVGGSAVGIEDDRHICTFAGSRAGKGRSAIIPNMLHWPGSVLATDPKGELATITARRRLEMGQTVHVLDPFGVAEGFPREQRLLTGFNPIAAMRDEYLIEDAALIADALVVPDGEAHWIDSARSLIEGLVMHVRTADAYEGRRHLLTVRTLAGEGARTATGSFSMDALIAEMRANLEPTGVVRMAAADYADRPANEKGSMLSTVRRHLKFLDLFHNPLGRMTLTHDGFRLSELKTKPTTIFLCLPARHIGTCGRWLRLFVNLTMQSMEQTRTAALPGRAPVLCVLDEFPSLGYLKQIEDSAGQIAGFGVKLWPILQDLGQLKALYGERWETFLANAGVLQFFGNSDLTTLDWISKRLGMTWVQHRSRSAVKHPEEPGDSYSGSLYELMTGEEVARFFGRDDPRLRQLVIVAGRSQSFLVVQRAFYDKHPYFLNASGVPLFDEPG